MKHSEWDKAKRVVYARDGGKCLRCLQEATDVHHRKPRGMGGSSDPELNYGLANLVSLCRHCHDRVHANPGESYELGWLVRSGLDPLEVPILVSATFTVWLTRDGDITGNSVNLF